MAAHWPRFPIVLAGAVLNACLLIGCSVNPPLDLAGLLPAQSQVHLQDTPFYPQQAHHCGPAALAGLLGAAGSPTTPAALTPQVYLPHRHGSLQLELLAATRRGGRIPYLTDGSPEALFAELLAGRPVLVFQNLQTRHFPAWHYAVLVGFDTGTNKIILNSGVDRGLAMAAPAFLRTWDWGGRWAMVALRPGELPARVALTPYLDAVAAFERVAGSAAAAPAWRVALGQWPQSPVPYLALGNTAYEAGDLSLATDYYRRGLLRQPQAAALANNLASVLGELGCPHAAQALLEPVAQGLATDSSWRPVIAATLAQLYALAALMPADSEVCGAR